MGQANHARRAAASVRGRGETVILQGRKVKCGVSIKTLESEVENVKTQQVRLYLVCSTKDVPPIVNNQLVAKHMSKTWLSTDRVDDVYAGLTTLTFEEQKHGVQ